jgi:hypothetical protein
MTARSFRAGTTEKAVTAAPTLTLEALVAKPDKQEGRLVRVVGQFRGRNLYGDLPISSEKSRSDWVIKDDLFAVWITGKKPKGSGWELDPSLKRDTGRWIEVIGQGEFDGPCCGSSRRLRAAHAPEPTDPFRHCPQTFHALAPSSSADHSEISAAFLGQSDDEAGAEGTQPESGGRGRRDETA